MPTVNHSITVTIDGFDRTSSLLKDALSVRSSLQNNTGVADIVVEEVEGYVPQPWDEVVVKVGSTTIFGGYVTNRNAQAVSGGANRRVRWSLAARDWTALFDRLIVTAQYSNRTDSAIVNSLIDTYLPGEGFVKSQIQFTTGGVTIGFENLTLRQALNKLASQVGAAWTVDASKGFYWFNRWHAYPAAFDINTDSPDNSTSYDVLAGSLRRTIEDGSAINRVTVVGADLQGPYTTEDFTVSEGERQWGPIEYAVHSFIRVTIEDAYGDTVAVFSGDQIGYEPDAVLMDWQNPAQAAIIGAKPKVEILVNREQRKFKIESAALANGYPADGHTINVVYFTSTPLTVTVDDDDLQGLHEHVFEYQAYAPDIADETQATYYAYNLLEALGRGRETVSFDVPEFGLMVGKQINIYAPEVDISPVVANADILLQDSGGWLSESGVRLVRQEEGEDVVSQIILQDGDDWLLEDSSLLRIEFSTDIGSYIIQEVSYRTVKTPSGYMVVASVSCGEAQQTIIDILSQLTGSGAVGSQPVANQRGKVSDIAGDLGEIVAGRAIFTDGGTAVFTWADPAGHTGAVIGLDNSVGTVQPTGKLLILESGTVRAALGPMTGMAAVGTVTPSGYGLWTNNGYFSGEVAASTIYGGTISGVQITGNYLDGGTISGALIYGGTVRTSANPVNSSNPGVYIDSTGLFGYGTAGLTFKIPTNPADRPIFSSGTILNTVYEVTTAAVIRTGTTNPRIQIDNSGIFAYNPSGSATVTIDVATGRLTAIDGIFSGSISASTITGGTVSGGRITGGTVSGALVSAGTVSGALVSAGTVSGALVSGGTVSGAVFSGGTVSQGNISAGTISGAQITGGTITGGTINSAYLLTPYLSAAYLNAGTVSGALVSAGTVSGGTVTGGYITGGTVNGALVTAGTLSTNAFQSGTITASQLSGGTVTGGYITGGTVNAAVFTGGITNAGSISAGTISGAYISGGSIVGGTVSGGVISGSVSNSGTINAGAISGAQISGGTVSVASGSVTLTNDGLKLAQMSASNQTAPTAIKWTSGTTLTAAIHSYRAGSEDFLEVAGGGAVIVAGDLVLNNEVRSHLIPNTTGEQYQLGDSTHGWRRLYLSNGSDVFMIEILTGPPPTLSITKMI